MTIASTVLQAHLERVFNERDAGTPAPPTQSRALWGGRDLYEQQAEYSGTEAIARAVTELLGRSADPVFFLMARPAMETTTWAKLLWRGHLPDGTTVVTVSTLLLSRKAHSLALCLRRPSGLLLVGGRQTTSDQETAQGPAHASRSVGGDHGRWQRSGWRHRDGVAEEGDMRSSHRQATRRGEVQPRISASARRLRHAGEPMRRPGQVACLLHWRRPRPRPPDQQRGHPDARTAGGVAARRHPSRVRRQRVWRIVRRERPSLPALRKARGRIVQVSTWTASLPLPFNGPSGASKSAMEVFASVYRAELKRFGIDVVIAAAGQPTRTGGPERQPPPFSESRTG